MNEVMSLFYYISLYAVGILTMALIGCLAYVVLNRQILKIRFENREKIRLLKALVDSHGFYFGWTAKLSFCASHISLSNGPSAYFKITLDGGPMKEIWVSFFLKKVYVSWNGNYPKDSELLTAIHKVLELEQPKI